jgi:hypothetical protein
MVFLLPAMWHDLLPCCQMVRPNKTLKLTGAAILVSRDIKVLQAAPAA